MVSRKGAGKKILLEGEGWAKNEKGAAGGITTNPVTKKKKNWGALGILDMKYGERGHSLHKV